MSKRLVTISSEPRRFASILEIKKQSILKQNRTQEGVDACCQALRQCDEESVSVHYELDEEDSGPYSAVVMAGDVTLGRFSVGAVGSIR